MQRGHLTVIEAPDMSEDQPRPVDVLCFQSQPIASSLEAPSHEADDGDASSQASNHTQDPLHSDSDRNPEAQIEQQCSAGQPEPANNPDDDNEALTEETDEETPTGSGVHSRALHFRLRYVRECE